MQHNRTYTTAEDVRRIEQEAAWYKKTIGRYQAIARKDKEGMLELVELIKDSQLQSQIQLNDALLRPTFDKAMIPPVFAAEVRVYSFILDLLENPKKLIERNKKLLEEAERNITEFKKLPRRD